MSSCSFLLLLLVLGCLQSFTTAYSGNGPDLCCFNFHNDEIQVRYITEYEVTRRDCKKPGIVFTLKKGRRVCADPNIQWVKEHMDEIDLRPFKSQI